jgi:acyl-CoA thioesterase I
MKIFLALGDSISLVRPDDGLNERDLYTYKLQEKLGNDYYVLNKSRVGNNIAWCVSEDSMVYHVKASSANFFSIQIGVVDCAPRMYTEEEKKHLAKLINYPIVGPYLKARIKRLSLKRYELTKERQIQLTPPDLFESHYRVLLANIFKYNKIANGFLINVGYPGEYFSSRNYNVQVNIENINKIIQKIALENCDRISVIDIYEYTKKNKDYILSDGHHYNGRVHDYIADFIFKKINAI